MNTKEANKIIAEYMGYEIGGVLFSYGDPLVECVHKNGNYQSKLYSESLDALVPVWEKLRIGYNIELISSCSLYFASVNRSTYYREDGVDTIQEASAIATAKAIQGLKT